jgi:hypothetical protein
VWLPLGLQRTFRHHGLIFLLSSTQSDLLKNQSYCSQTSLIFLNQSDFPRYRWGCSAVFEGILKLLGLLGLLQLLSELSRGCKGYYSYYQKNRGVVRVITVIIRIIEGLLGLLQLLSELSRGC